MGEGERKGRRLGGVCVCVCVCVRHLGGSSLCFAAPAGSLVLVSFLSPSCIEHVRTNLK